MKQYRQLQSERGSAMLIALLLIGMLSVLGIATIRTTTTDVTLSYNQSHSRSAFYLAEAGAKRAYLAINEDLSWRDGYDSEAFGQGTYEVIVKDSSTDAGLDDTVIIYSISEAHDASSEIELWLVPGGGRRPFPYGLFAGTSVIFDKNAATDSYNSDSGTYVATKLSEAGDIGCNGVVTTSQTCNIGGNISTAGGAITLGAGTTVTGSTSTTADSVPLDLVPASEYTWAQGESIASSGISGSGYTYNAATKKLTGGANSIITLQTGIYYFSSIALGKLSQIKLAAGASVTIYMDGGLELGQQCELNKDGKPANLQIYSQNGGIAFNQSNIFYGTFYGPNGQVQFDQTSQVYGAIVAKTVKLDQGAKFHYDRDLANITRGGGTGMTIVAWREL
jgi:hypothetical protein